MGILGKGVLAGAAAWLVIVIGHVVAASNTVEPSRVGELHAAVTPAALQPALCAQNGISPTTLVAGNGAVTGTPGSDLILAGPGADTIAGRGGDDCLVSGAVPKGRRDRLRPAARSASVCIGGPGPGGYVYGPGCRATG